MRSRPTSSGWLILIGLIIFAFGVALIPILIGVFAPEQKSPTSPPRRWQASQSQASTPSVPGVAEPIHMRYLKHGGDVVTTP